MYWARRNRHRLLLCRCVELAWVQLLPDDLEPAQWAGRQHHGLLLSWRVRCWEQTQTTVQPGTRGTIIPHNYGQRVAAWVHASAPVVVERPTYFSNYTVGNAGTVSGSASVVGATAPSANWRFAEGYVGGQFQENLVLANVGTSVASGTLMSGIRQWLDPDGAGDGECAR